MQMIAIQTEAVFQALADKTRLRIIRLMVVTGDESCLCELVDSLLEPSYKLSRHLKILRQAGLLSSQKEGRWVYHRLLMKPAYLESLYATVQALPDSKEIYSADLKRFRERLCLREGGRCQIGIQSEAFKSEAG
ncbi:transcriptional regulator, ArsR family [hydrothermal vent metagenome]|uniref:Transcriptional regulator, ArsR family n=1 Tax=hydrothermal vent metagenome TaxID=652676 RepID=A0A3B1AT50_9ZZZZ